MYPGNDSANRNEHQGPLRQRAKLDVQVDPDLWLRLSLRISAAATFSGWMPAGPHQVMVSPSLTPPPRLGEQLRGLVEVVAVVRQAIRCIERRPSGETGCSSRKPPRKP